jgi:hypothetical protein
MFSSNSVTKKERSEITITLTGYPANYKNIRNFELKDTANFIPKNIAIVSPNENEVKTSVSQSAEIIKKSKGKGLVIGAILVGTIIIIASLF